MKTKFQKLFLFCFLLYLSLPANAMTDDMLLKSGLWRDPMTNLIWSRCSLGQKWTGSVCVGEANLYKYDKAIAELKKLHSRGYGQWRIPNIEELRTLMLKEKEGYNTPLNALFTPIPNYYGWYWSSSVDVNDNSTIWMVAFNFGLDSPVDKSLNLNVRLVRSGD